MDRLDKTDKKIMLGLLVWIAAWMTISLAGCHQTPAERFSEGRPLCGADTAYACYAVGHGTSAMVDPVSGQPCARCYPANPDLDWCWLDGVTDGAHSTVLAGEWYTCVHDCGLCEAP
jgi:hypothetical protein